MEPHFYNDDDFEELLKQKADEYKMYPSEKVWKEIHRTLPPRKKWYLFGFALLLSGLGLYTANELAGSGSASKPLAQKTKAALTKKRAGTNCVRSNFLIIVHLRNLLLYLTIFKILIISHLLIN